MKKLTTTITILIMLFATSAYALDSLRFYRNYTGDQTFAIPQGR